MNTPTRKPMGNVISLADFKSKRIEEDTARVRLQLRILRMLNRSVELRASLCYRQTVESREEAVIASSALRIEALRLADGAGITVIEEGTTFKLGSISTSEG